MSDRRESWAKCPECGLPVDPILCGQGKRNAHVLCADERSSSEGKEPGAKRAVSRQHPFEADQYVGRTVIKNWLSVSDDTLREFEQEPDFPVAVLVGSRRKYLGADLVRWLWTRQG